ncbi:FAD-linked oxidase [Ktedonobacter sp. SOSP1-52]|uniref:FAD-binding oxidoreductase n=1 Tax=Ktedonobacter sp. SOSP1-52 TaxID=2778366 RepID=UPI001915DA90|nr:FAD-binding oxidoreductase [Ktedonobacter sp. SOSP1-52]GHO67627.1 FAD-linked oxidase [Ktedonobacter sp. SOSP1-52]
MGESILLAQSLQTHLPSLTLLQAAEQRHTYAVDDVAPKFILIPDTIEEAAQAVALIHQYGGTIQARGNGTYIHLGGIPSPFDTVLLTTRLDHLLEHEAGDLTCRVEAGMPLATLQALLARKGQRLPLDPPHAEQATIGGLLAANASGPKRLLYGTARDLVIGLRVIQANGEIARSGGRVVKNVAGYDLNKLFIGSLSTLGIIVEANFKLQPLPPAEHTLLLTYTNVEDAMQTVTQLLGSVITPTALELIDSGAASVMSDFHGINLPVNGYTLAVNFEGSLSTIERQINETRLLARRQHALLGEDLTNHAQEHFWQTIRQQTQGTLTCKINLLPSQIPHYLRILSSTCHQYDLEATNIAHAGNGIVYTELQPVDATPRLVGTLTALRSAVQALRGSLVIEHCPTQLKQHIDVWGEPGAAFTMMQRLKSQFDPQETFIKGRFLGGL